MGGRGLFGGGASRRGGLGLLALALVAGGGRVTSAPSQARAGAAAGDYARLPLAFEPNRGQFDARVRFAARGSGASLALLDRELVLALPGGDTLRLRFARADASPRALGLVALPARVNYPLASDPPGAQCG